MAVPISKYVKGQNKGIMVLKYSEVIRKKKNP